MPPPPIRSDPREDPVTFDMRGTVETIANHVLETRKMLADESALRRTRDTEVTRQFYSVNERLDAISSAVKASPRPNVVPLRPPQEVFEERRWGEDTQKIILEAIDRRELQKEAQFGREVKGIGKSSFKAIVITLAVAIAGLLAGVLVREAQLHPSSPASAEHVP